MFQAVSNRSADFLPVYNFWLLIKLCRRFQNLFPTIIFFSWKERKKIRAKIFEFELSKLYSIPFIILFYFTFFFIYKENGIWHIVVLEFRFLYMHKSSISCFRFPFLFLLSFFFSFPFLRFDIILEAVGRRDSYRWADITESGFIYAKTRWEWISIQLQEPYLSRREGEREERRTGCGRQSLDKKGVVNFNHFLFLNLLIKKKIIIIK